MANQVSADYAATGRVGTVGTTVLPTYEEPSFYQWEPNLCLIGLWVIGALIYGYAVKVACDYVTRRVLGSFPVWMVLRIGFFLLMGLVVNISAGIIDIIILAIIEWLLVWQGQLHWYGGWTFFAADIESEHVDGTLSASARVGSSGWPGHRAENHGYAWVTGRDDCPGCHGIWGPCGGHCLSHVSGCDRRANCGCDVWYRDCVSRRQFRYMLLILMIEFVALILGNFVLGYILITDGLTSIYLSSGVTFWVLVFLVAILGAVVYRWIVESSATRWVRSALLNPRTWIVISAWFWLLVGVLSGSPPYYALVMIIILYILWAICSCFRCEDGYRHQWAWAWDLLIFAVLAYAAGAWFIRPFCMDHIPVGEVAAAAHYYGWSGGVNWVFRSFGLSE